MENNLQKEFEYTLNDNDLVDENCGYKPNSSEVIDEDCITIEKIRNGEKWRIDELLKKYDPLVNKISGNYFVPGGNEDDVRQEGRVGLYNAIKRFDSSKMTSFKGFASTCIKRSVVSAVKNSNRQKHIPLNSSVSLTQDAYGDSEEGGKQLIDTIEIETPDVAESVVTNESYYQACAKMNKVLSPLERQVFQLKLFGYSYGQMAKEIGTSEKAIDNAVQRIKSKLTKHIDNNEMEI